MTTFTIPSITPGTPLLDAMLFYALHGWPVFVLRPDGKAPVARCEPCKRDHLTPEQMEACECLTCHGFYAATVDGARILEMATRHPHGQLGLRTGAVSGTVVIDVDPPIGLKTMAKLDEAELLPGTVTQMSPRGGLHLIYGHPGVRITSGAGRAGPGVDVKADAAYILVSPSAHARTGHPYRWVGDRFTDPLTPLHPALVERLQAPAPPPRPLFTQPRSARTGGARGRLSGLLETVLSAPEGQRNGVLHWAACKAGEMVAAGEISEHLAFEALRAAGERIGLTSSEIGTAPGRGTIGSGMRRGQGAA